ncbi:MAG TPA: ABC transporter substrate-binding protein [Chloroflexota bacterium]|nr:ABC transporter substrate-binding protein [Chloroflexota bacterium]
MSQRRTGSEDYLERVPSIPITRRRFLLGFSVAAGGALLVACGPAPAGPAAAPTAAAKPAAAAKPSGSRPDELVLCWGTFQLQTKNLDPQTHVGTIAESQLRHMFEPLVQIDRDLQTVKPQLATEWKRLDDLTIQFKLRQGVKFHNGEEFDAEGAKFSVLRPVDPATGADARTTYAGISGVDVLDKYTINVKTAKPDPALLLRMTGFSMTMVAPKWASQGMDVFTKEAVGTGPYKLASWSGPLQDWTMVANEQYWGGAPKVKKVRIKTIPELATRTAALRSGEVHVAKDIAVEEMDAINKSGRALAKTTPSNRIPYYVMDVRKPPCDNRLLRQAINYAANIDGIIQSVLYGNATRVATTVAPWHVGFNPDLKPYPYDADKAKSLMREAGFANGFDLNINYIQGRYLKDKEVAEAIAQELNKVGIRAKPVLREAALQTQEDLAQRLDGLIFASWGNWIFDADNQLFVRWHTSARDTANAGKLQSSLPYSNPEFDTLVEQARIELDEKKRLDLYKKAQQILYDDAAGLFMYTLTDIYGVDNWVLWEPRKDEMIWAHEMAWNE